ncbi:MULTISPECIES: small secreted protein [Streptomyces]|uniref:small secreted protein n=1 Tax=Streptomyces TaxID=1883 RepID=UPI000C6E3EA5|nr:small secreted protein [Streptomyces sp. EAG2]PKR46097.1 small secreted protein [Streptomyces sp. EAG2]
MNKKLAAALSGGAVLAMALTGCGDDKEEKLDAWAKQVCDDVQPQAKKISDANAAIQEQTSDNSSPEDVQKTDSKAFGDMSAAYKAIGSAVNKAGAPPVDDGEKTKNDAVKELNGISTAYGDLKKQVDALDTGDQGEFADGLKDIAGELSKISKSGNEALEKLQSGEVGEAMKNQESCKSSTTSPAPSPSGS